MGLPEVATVQPRRASVDPAAGQSMERSVRSKPSTQLSLSSCSTHRHRRHPQRILSVARKVEERRVALREGGQAGGRSSRHRADS
jgi:hypothetical protein